MPFFSIAGIPDQNGIFGAAIKIKGCHIASWRALYGLSFSGRDFGAQLLRDFLRDLALDRERIFQIAVVLFCPDMRVGARVDQLRVDMQPSACLTDAAF